MKKFKLLCAAAAVMVPTFTALAPSAYAQEITASVSGEVTDEAGAPIRGATVTVTDTRTGETRTITTGGDGGFSAQGLVTGGPYTIVCAAALGAWFVLEAPRGMAQPDPATVRMTAGWLMCRRTAHATPRAVRSRPTR